MPYESKRKTMFVFRWKATREINLSELFIQYDFNLKGLLDFSFATAKKKLNYDCGILLALISATAIVC